MPSDLEVPWLNLVKKWGREPKIAEVIDKDDQTGLQAEILEVIETQITAVVKSNKIVLSFKDQELLEYFVENYQFAWINPLLNMNQTFRPVSQQVELGKMKLKSALIGRTKKLVIYGSKVPNQGFIFKFKKIQHPPIKIYFKISKKGKLERPQTYI